MEKDLPRFQEAFTNGRQKDPHQGGTISYGGGFSTQIQFDGGVSLSGGGFTGHAWWAARCMAQHPDSLPGTLPDHTWKGNLRAEPGEAFADAGAHSDGDAYVVRDFAGAEVGPIDPASV